MNEYIQNFDINQYLPAAIAWATNILMAILILLLGIWISGKAYTTVYSFGKRYERLDDTLFRFFGSIARYVILTFVFISVLNRFGVQTTSIVALIGAAGLAVGLALQGAMSNLALCC
jgi:small conductance mechanosensitive channel